MGYGPTPVSSVNQFLSVPLENCHLTNLGLISSLRKELSHTVLQLTQREIQTKIAWWSARRSLVLSPRDSRDELMASGDNQLSAFTQMSIVRHSSARYVWDRFGLETLRSRLDFNEAIETASSVPPFANLINDPHSHSSFGSALISKSAHISSPVTVRRNPGSHFYSHRGSEVSDLASDSFDTTRRLVRDLRISRVPLMSLRDCSHRLCPAGNSAPYAETSSKRAAKCRIITISRSAEKRKQLCRPAPQFKSPKDRSGLRVARHASIP